MLRIHCDRCGGFIKNLKEYDQNVANTFHRPMLCKVCETRDTEAQQIIHKIELEAKKRFDSIVSAMQDKMAKALDELNEP